MASTYFRAIKKFERLRQSNLAIFDRCALSAHFDLEYRKNWDGHPQARGKVFHHVAARCLAVMYEQQERTIPVDAALEILHDTIRQHGVDDHCGKCGAPAKVIPGKQMIKCENGHAHGSNLVNLPMDTLADLRWVTVKFAHDNSFDIENLVDVEQRIMFELTYPDAREPSGKVSRVLSGQLDALFVVGEEADHAVVLDWKDTWALPAPTEIGFDGYFQQRFYAWLVMRNFPTVNQVTLREFYVRYSTAREAHVWRSDLDEIEAELAALAERFDRSFHERNFPASPGRHCQFCSLPEKCPIFEGVRAEGRIQNDEDASRFSRQATVAKAVLDNRIRELKSWTSVRGPVLISDHKGVRAWGFHEAKRTARPTRAQVDAALEAGMPIDSLYREQTVTRFGEHTPEPHPPAESDEALMDALKQSVKPRDTLAPPDRGERDVA